MRGQQQEPGPEQQRGSVAPSRSRAPQRGSWVLSHSSYFWITHPQPPLGTFQAGGTNPGGDPSLTPLTRLGGAAVPGG